MFFNPQIEKIFQSIPLSLLEFWGSFGFIMGIALMFFAYGGFTFRPGPKWVLGKEWHAWDGKSFLSMGITFVLIWVSGFIGSFFVLVPGAQTFESFKDLSVFLCVVLFGYPALLVVPFAYGLSDFYEGIPVEFMSDWWIGYFINPSFFWLALQFIGKCPDFRKLRTWKRYLWFVLIFMSLEPFLWGYICSGKFSTKDAYHVISPALFYTTLITWCVAPFAMLLLYPLAGKLGYFWAEISGHVKQREIRNKEWVWISGNGESTEFDCTTDSDAGVPIRFFFLAPFIVVALFMMGATSYFALKSSEEGAIDHAEKFHEVISDKVNLMLSDYLSGRPQADINGSEINNILRDEPTKVFIINHAGDLISEHGEPAISLFKTTIDEFRKNGHHRFFRITLKSARKLSKETWLIQARPVSGRRDLILLTAMPESFYLSGVRQGQTNSSLIFAFGLVLVLVVVGILGAMVIAPIRRACHAARELSMGNLNLRLPESRLAEMNTLSIAFNKMAESLQKTFQELSDKENRLKLAVQTGNIGIWEWNLLTNTIYWSDIMYVHHNLKMHSPVNIDTWADLLIPEDHDRMKNEIQSNIESGNEYNTEYKIRWNNGTIRTLLTHGQTIRDESGKAIRFIGITYDITRKKTEENELMLYRNQLEEVISKRTRELEEKSAQVQELVEKQAKAEVYEKIAQIFLSMRDYTNSPLQALNFAIALMKRRSPDQMDIIENLEASVQRLSSINRILTRLESSFSNTKLLSEEEILQYLDKIEQGS